MTEPTASQISVQDPLSAVSRSERKILLGVSVLSIAIVKTGLIPTKISALGIEFSQADRSALLSILALVVLYFTVAFLIYAIADFIDWRIKFNVSVRNIIKQREEKRKKGDDESGRFPMSRVRGLTRPVSVVRALFDFLLPVIAGVYAIFILLGAR